MPIKSLRVTDVGPFDDITFEFDPQVNVFTGPNNSGKSTALWCLSELMVYPFAFPKKVLRKQETTFKCVLQVGETTHEFSDSLPNPAERQAELLALVGFTTFVPALRYGSDFRSTGPSVQKPENIPSGSINKEEFENPTTVPATTWAHRPFSEYYRWVIRTGTPEEPPDLRKRRSLFSSDAAIVPDQTVIQKMIDLDYLSYIEKRENVRLLISQVAEIASDITESFKLDFVGVGKDETGYFPKFATPDGEMPLNSLSQGTQSTIQWLARLVIGYAEYYDFAPDFTEKPGLVIIDEIDAHLHPSWQRRIIPTLTNHFPNLQIFCSTHSPLMLAGLKKNQVQLLRRDENNKVVVTRNEEDIVGWSADEIYRAFLDVPNPTDLETVNSINRLQELRRKRRLTAEEKTELEELRQKINQDLVAGPIAAQMERFNELLASAQNGKPAKPSSPSKRRS